MARFREHSASVFGGTVLVVLLAVVLAWGGQSQPDLNTPKDTMESLIRAASTLDAHLWAQGLSSTDRAHFDAMNSPDNQRYLKQQKQGFEGRYGRAIGQDFFEFANLQLIVDVTAGKGLPDAVVAMAQITEESIWDDRYAEMTLVLPLEVRGYLPPMKFFFLKEHGQWKLCQWLAARLMLGWDIGRRGYPDATINILLKAHTDMDFDRGNCANLKQRTFPVSETVSAAYRKAIEAATPYARNQLLLLWAIAGDKEAERRIAEEDAKDPKAGLLNAMRQYAKAAAALKPCGPQLQPSIAGENLIPESPQFWLRTLENDPIGLRAFLKRFPQERHWCAKALMSLAAIELGNKSYPEAAADYESVVKAYPEFPEEIVEAKSRLAGLCWRNLNRKEEAQRLWRELEVIGKLPPDAALGERPLNITTLLQDSEAAWMSGMQDFDLAPDAGLVVLRVPSQGAKKPGGGALRSIDLVDASGKFLKTLVQEERVPKINANEFFMEVQRFGDKYCVRLNATGKFLVFEGSGQLKTELTMQGNQFEASGARSVASSKNYSVAINPRAFFMQDGSFAVLFQEKVSRFNYAGAPLNEFAIPREDARGNTPSRLTGNRKGDLVFTQPSQGRVFRLDRAGTVTPMKNADTPEGSFSRISHLLTDQFRNIYLVDPPSRKVLKFDSAGKYVRSFGHESITEPTSATVDEQGNVYVIGYGFTGGSTVTVIDGEGRFVRAVQIPTDAVHAGNRNILDVEISRGDIYAVVGQYVIRCDRDGHLLSSSKPAAERDNPILFKDASGQVYFSQGAQIFRYDGGASQPLALPLGESDARDAAAGRLRVAGVDRNGVLIGTASGTDVARVDLAKATFRRVKRASGFCASGLMAADADGNILTTNELGTEVLAIAPDGTVSTLVKAQHNARQAWHPEEVVLDKQDNIYVYDGTNRSMLKFRADGSFVAETYLGSQVPGWVKRVRLDEQDRIFLLTENDNQRSIVRIDLSSMFEDGSH